MDAVCLDFILHLVHFKSNKTWIKCYSYLMEALLFSTVMPAGVIW